MTDKEMADFDKWQKLWDNSAEQLSKEYTNQLVQNQQVATSWLTNSPLDRDYQATNDDIESDVSWRDIFDRSQDIDDLILEEYKGDKKPQAHFGAFTPTKTNPTQQSSTGQDGVDPTKDGGIRVTPNWSDSEDLRELDEIKRRLEALERKHHESEVKSEKSEPSLRKQLESLRGMVSKLSEKINIGPEVDVT